MDVLRTEMSGFYYFLGWERLFVDVIRVARIRSIFFRQGNSIETLCGNPVKFRAICSVDIYARRKAKSDSENTDTIFNFNSSHSQIFEVCSQIRVCRRDGPTPSRG